MSNEKLITTIKLVLLVFVLYLFLLSIQLISTSLKMLGSGFAEALIATTSNPFVGLLIGIVATSLIQSSSTTTALVVGFVGGGVLTLRNSIPIIMGANIGTTITNTIVSFGFLGRKAEFRRAFASSTVHDFYNILAVFVLFPLEMIFRPIEQSASFISGIFTDIGGAKIMSPLKLILNPVIEFLQINLKSPVLLLIIALIFLFISLTFMVKVIRSLILDKMEKFLNRYLFKNDGTSFSLGIIFTAIVQSSSITTSLVVPLCGAGLLTVRQIFPYTLGSNIGTTVTALLAALATVNPVAVTVAISHLFFNIFGIIIFYPLKKLPIFLAEGFARVTVKSKKNTVLFIIIYILMHFVILGFVFLFE